MSLAVQSPPASFSPSKSQLDVAYSVCRGITRSAAKNFYYAFLVLPEAKRAALCAVYAFMRKCDDISDDTSLPIEQRRQKLDAWLDAAHRAQAGLPTDEPVLLALTDTQQRFGIASTLLDQLAEGTAMDLPSVAMGSTPSAPIEYRTFEDLYQYCYRVASVVGLVCIRVFGYRDLQAELYAEKLGIAFQLTNIIRDVKEDAANSRVYLPEEDLARYGLTSAVILDSPDPARLRDLLAMEADRARDYYRAGDQLLPLIDEDSRPALWVLTTIYRTLLERIAAQRFEVYRTRVSLSTWEKLTILGKGFLRRFS
ncbi:MAG: phytoene/squalene synthase family protein [Acidobacteriales bacterium]|nr:phytoene/squalene synthase family protein [Terriglobales bacterium]